jgi:RecA/RadA recombinase
MTLVEILDTLGVSYEQKETDNLYIECPDCGKKKLSINVFSGAWHCWSLECEERGSRGSLPLLAQKLGFQPNDFTPSEAPARDRSLKDEDRQRIYSYQQNKTQVIEWCATRALDSVFALKQGVGFDAQTNSIVFPFRDAEGVLIGAKFRCLTNGDQWIKGVEPPLYSPTGQIPKLDKVVIVEGEVDAFTLAQFGIPCVATLGAGKDKGFGILSGVRQIYLGYDMDPAGEAGAEKAAQALGSHRCRRVTWGAKDPNDWVQAGATKGDLIQAIKSAKVLARNLMSISAKDTLQEYFNECAKGVKPRRSWGFNRLDSFTKGLGGGELVGVLAESGTGKTTFILNTLRNHVEQGVRCGFASLEEHPITEISPKLASVMLGQNIQLRGTTIDEMRSVSDKMGMVQLFTGEPNLAKVVDWVRECYFVHDCKMVAIDYFQLLVPDEESVQGIKDTIFALKNLTKELHELCILLVIQPKQRQKARTKEGREAKPLKLDGADARGGAAINQTVDKMLTIVGVPGHSNITQYEFTKCRGHMNVSKKDWLLQLTQLEYDHSTLRMSELSQIIYGSED